VNYSTDSGLQWEADLKPPVRFEANVAPLEGSVHKANKAQRPDDLCACDVRALAPSRMAL